MSMNYTPPGNVTSPQHYVSNVRVIYDGGQNSASVAIIDWEGEPRLAMRWNVAGNEWNDPEKKSGAKLCVGMPTSRGYPTWFVLPDEMVDDDSGVARAIKKAKELIKLQGNKIETLKTKSATQGVTFNIGGTVIQRSFVGRGITNVINIATVPCTELGIKNSTLELEDVVSELLGVPRESVLCDQDVTRVAQIIQKQPPHHYWPFWNRELERQYTSMSELYRETDAKAFIGDFVSLVSSPIQSGIFPFFYPLPFNEKPFKLNNEAIHLALLCLSARLQKGDDTRAFYNELLTYDIPLGQSPETKDESLMKLLETSKKVCLAPLGLGGAQGMNLLNQGHYVAALQTTGTAGAMTLILIGTISVGSVIVQKVAQNRSNNAEKRKPQLEKPKKEN